MALPYQSHVYEVENKHQQIVRDGKRLTRESRDLKDLIGPNISTVASTQQDMFGYNGHRPHCHHDVALLLLQLKYGVRPKGGYRGGHLSTGGPLLGLIAASLN